MLGSPLPQCMLERCTHPHPNMPRWVGIVACKLESFQSGKKRGNWRVKVPAVAVCYQRQAAEQAEAGELLQSLRLLKAACVEVQLAQLGAAQSGGKAPLAHLIHDASEPETE